MLPKYRSQKYVCFCLVSFLIICPHPNYGFRLRDLTAPDRDDINKSPKKTFRDLTNADADKSRFKKIVKVVHVNDDGTELEEEFEFKFEKVHKTDFPLPSSVKVDGEGEERPPQSVFKAIEEDKTVEENIEIEESTEKLSFSLSTLLGVIGFGVKESENLSNPNIDNKLIDWLTSFKRTEIVDEPSKIEIEATQSWISYLNRWPFNLLFPHENIENISTMQGQNISWKLGKGSMMEPMSQDYFEHLIHKLPNFVLNASAVENMECRKQLQIFQRQLRGYKLWTFQMLDSTAKITSGLLRGNINQFGDFEVCTQIKTTVKVTKDQSVRIKGKYCLAHIDIQTTEPDLKLPIHLVQGRGFFKSHIGNPLHFVPRYTTANWGVCIPNSCNADNVYQMLHNNFELYNRSGIHFHIQINDNDCYVKQNQKFLTLLTNNWKLQFAIGFYLCFIIIVLIASIVDHWSITMKKIRSLLKNYLKQTDFEQITIDENSSQPESELFQYAKKVLFSFSLKRTCKQLITKKHNFNDTILQLLNIISILFLYMFVKFLMLGHLPITNRDKSVKILTNPLSIFLRTPFIYLDVFLLISGTLSTYQMCHEIESKSNIIILRRFVGKIFRSLPSLFAVLFFQTWILPLLGSGPLWGNLVDNNSKLCEENMWRYFFQTQNIKNIEETCAPFSIQLAIDVQLFLIAPLIVCLYYNNSDAALGLYGFFHAISVALRYSRTINERLTSVLFHGMNVSQFYRTANILYSSPIYRATSYLIGIGNGLILKSYANQKVKLSKGTVAVTSIAAGYGIFWCFWYPSNSTHFDFIYDPLEAAVYSSWAPLLMSLALSWIIFISITTNLDSYLNVLPSRILMFFNNISYPMQLVLYIVIIYTTADTKEHTQFSLDHLVNIKEIVIIVFISTILAIIIDVPMQNLRKILIEYDGMHKKAIEEPVNLEIEDIPERNKDLIELSKSDEHLFIKEEHSNESPTNGVHFEANSRNQNLKIELDEDLQNSNERLESDLNSGKSVQDESKVSNIENDKQPENGVEREVEEADEEEEEEEEEEDEITEEDEIIRRPLTPEPYRHRRWNMDEY